MRHEHRPLWWGSALTAVLGLSAGSLSLCAAQRTPKRARRTVEDSFTPSVAQLVVESGDTLWAICDRITGKPWIWPRVWALNPELTNPHWVYPGDVVRFVAPTEAPPSRAEMVASSVDIPQLSDTAADQASQGPRVEVINTPRAPAKDKRLLRHHVFDGVFVSLDELEAAGQLTNAPVDKILLGPTDTVYVTFPRDHAPKARDRYLVYRTTTEVMHPETGSRFGYMGEITGALTVLATDDDIATARVDNAIREMERGQYVMPFNENLMLSIETVPSSSQAEGVVVAIEGEVVAASEQNLVFVDIGSKDGVKRGNELTVSLRGDPLGQDRPLPKMDVATLLVVDAKETFSTCLVTDSTQEIWLGDPVRSVGEPR